MDAAAPTTAKKLKAAGYAIAHFGKWHRGRGRDVDDAPRPQAYSFKESLVAFRGLGDRLLGNPKNNSVKLGQGEISFCNRRGLALSRRAQPEKLIKTWAYEDGRAATLLAMEVPDPAFSGTLMQQASRRWSGQDPSAPAA